MANGLAVAPGVGFTGSTATLKTNATDKAQVVTFTTSSTIPGAGPYLLFTLTYAGSWGSPYDDGPTVLAGASANFSLSRTSSQMQACANLGPFFTIPDSHNYTVAVYCTNAPSISTAYDIGLISIAGP